MFPFPQTPPRSEGGLFTRSSRESVPPPERHLIDTLAGGGISKTTPLDPNILINDRYKVIEYIGSGGFGNVFKVEDIRKPAGVTTTRGVRRRSDAVASTSWATEEEDEASSGGGGGEASIRYRSFALKVLKSGFPAGTATKAAWREVRTLYTLFCHDPQGRESHAVNMKRAFNHSGHMFMLYSLLGPNLSKALRVKKNGFSLSEVKIIGKQLIQGLAFLHNKVNIVHHDIKPDNVAFLYYPEGSSASASSSAGASDDPDTEHREDNALSLSMSQSRLEIRILDYGSSAYPLEQYMGFKPATTRPYRAPEMTFAAPWDSGVDVWSLGVTLWELYTGKRLFNCRHDWDLLFLMEATVGPIPKRFAHQISTKATFDAQGWLTRDQMRKLSEGLLMPTRFEYTRENLQYSRPECGEFMELLGEMMVMNPSQRITSQQVLAHPFWLS